MVQRFRVLSTSATLTHVSALFGAMGMLMVLFGFYTIRRTLGDSSAGDALARFGVVLLTFAAFRFAFTNGRDDMIAHVINHGLEKDRSMAALVPPAVDIQAVKAGILIISGTATCSPLLSSALACAPV